MLGEKSTGITVQPQEDYLRQIRTRSSTFVISKVECKPYVSQCVSSRLGRDLR